MSKAGETTTVQWFKNGDHPLDYAEGREGFENGELVTFSAERCKANEWEGAIVRYYRRPNVAGLVDCHLCGATMHEHGWLDDGGNGEAVCPGDFIVTTDGRHMVVQQPDRAEAQAKAQQAQDRKDAERYRLQSQIDACRPYLKDGETPAECLARNRADIVRLMGKWGAEKMRSAKLRDDLDKIAQTTGSDDPCRPHLKEGETVADALIRMQKEITTLRNAAMQLWAGRRTFDKGNDMNLGDLFDKRDKQAEEDRKDAARYRWLLEHPIFAFHCFSYDAPDQISAEVDKARAAHEVAG